MGLSSRDYYRESTPSPWVLGEAPIVKYLIIANIIVFLFQILVVRPQRVPDLEAAIRTSEQGQQLTQEQIRELIRNSQRVPVLQEWLELDTDKVVKDGQVWRLLTHAFCHDRHSIFHIFFNMLILFWFGRTLETMYGSSEFLLFYLTAAVFAGLAYTGMNLFTGSSIPAIGASGAVMAVMMLYTVHFPREVFYIFWFIPVEMRWLMVFYVIWDLHPILLTLSGERIFTGIGHAAHLGGLVFGFLYAHYEWRIGSLMGRIPLLGSLPVILNRGRPGRPRSATPKRELDSARLDQVLEKISRSGKDSLTEEERDILRASSERLKTRALGS